MKKFSQKNLPKAKEDKVNLTKIIQILVSIIVLENPDKRLYRNRLVNSIHSNIEQNDPLFGKESFTKIDISTAIDLCDVMGIFKLRFDENWQYFIDMQQPHAKCIIENCDKNYKEQVNNFYKKMTQEREMN